MVTVGVALFVTITVIFMLSYRLRCTRILLPLGIVPLPSQLAVKLIQLYDAESKELSWMCLLYQINDSIIRYLNIDVSYFWATRNYVQVP